MRLLFLLGSRGEWGYIRPVIDEARERGHLALICATNMALLASYGALADVVANQGYDIKYRILNSIEGSSRAAMAKSMGVLQMAFVDVLTQEQPDWVILAGDRAEQLAAATTCAYTYTPTAHIQSGERSGNIDGTARHAIARLVHLHFASNPDAAERLIRSGEDSWRVHLTGAPQLDDIRRHALPDSSDGAYAEVRPDGDFLLACFHPVTEQSERTELQLSATLDVLSDQSMPVVWILPNNDAGGSAVRSVILSSIRGVDRAYPNLRREHYLALMRDCRALIGNSSSGLLEAPSFGTPAVNVGRRQADRVQGPNVVNALNGTRHEISAALERALSAAFKRDLAAQGNPYGDGYSSPRILDVLESTTIDDELVSKQITY